VIADTVTDELTGDDRDLDESNDLEYLLGPVGDGLDDDDFEDDTVRPKCAVAEWSQVVGYLPNLSEYETGQSTPPGDVRDVRPEMLSDK
jgi:hypothetical protein